MSAPFVNQRVVVTGTSQRELNNLSGQAIAYTTDTMRYTVLLDNGRTVALKGVNLMLEPVDARRSTVPDVRQVMGALGLPLWLVNKLAKGELPSMDDISGVLPSLLPVGFSVIAALFLLLRFGLVKTLVVCGMATVIAYYCYLPFKQAGGGIPGLRACALAMGDQITSHVQQVTGYYIPRPWVLGASGVALAAVCYFLLSHNAATNSPSDYRSYSPPSGRTVPLHDTSYSTTTNPTYSSSTSGHMNSRGLSVHLLLAIEAAYEAGHAEGTANKPLDWTNYYTQAGLETVVSDVQQYARQLCTDNNAQFQYDHQQQAAQNGRGFGGGLLSFSFGKIFSMIILGRQVYTLGAVPGGWSVDLAVANIRHQSVMQNFFLGLLVLRILGLSPI